MKRKEWWLKKLAEKNQTVKEEQLDQRIQVWEKAWGLHGASYHADAYEEEEEDNAPLEATARPAGLGEGPHEDMDDGPPDEPMQVSPVS